MQNNSKCKASLISVCQGLFASLPACFSDVCVAAAGRKDNRVIVPLKNYDSVYDAACCNQAPQKLDVGDEQSNCQTRKMTAFLFTFYLTAFTGTHPTEKGLEELENM